MKRVAPTALAVAAALALCPGLGRAVETGPVVEAQRAPSATYAEPAMDPMIRALLLGLAASLLREAAASPDPLNTFGESLERKLHFALRSPEFARLAEGLIDRAVRDAPAELREPLAQFATAMLNNLRREMLDGARPRSRY